MEVGIAIVTSFIASVVFYFFFQFIPERKKYKTIRPRLELELVEMAFSLYFYLEVPFRHNIHSPSFFQKEIEKQLLEKPDMRKSM